MISSPVNLTTRPLPSGYTHIVVPPTALRSTHIHPPTLPPSVPILPSSTMTLQSSNMLHILHPSSTAHFHTLPFQNVASDFHAPSADPRLPDFGKPMHFEPADLPIEKNDNCQFDATSFLLGVFVALVVVIIPIWDGFALLRDPVWVYMCGRALPIILISVVSAVALFYTVVLSCSLCKGRVRQEQTFLNIAILFVLLLGTVFVTMSTPIQGQARLATSELMFNCQSGLLSEPLYHAYQNLQTLRKTPSCAGNFSVEDCAGYEKSDLNSIIKGMENRMGCSGFCFYPNASANVSATPASAMNASYGYPPALFSKAGMQGSCSAMAARDMEGFALDMGTRLQWEGYFLMAASIVQGLLLVAGSCVKQEMRLKTYSVEDPFETSGYGTIQYAAGAADFRKRL